MADNVVVKIKEVFEGLVKDKKTLVKILSVALILALALIMKIHESAKADVTIETGDGAGSEAYEEDQEEQEGSAEIVVDISGAVKKPGVYCVSPDTRLYQVIEMAGGLTDEADTDSVNRASYVEDGQKIIIPVKGSDPPDDVAPSADPAAAADTEGLVNINTASAEELKTLNGIGDVMAERIIEYRTSHAFKNKEDIMQVNGIGQKMYDKIKDRITC